MKNDKKLGYLVVLLGLIISIVFFSSKNLLIPNGYELAVDGYVISRTLLLVFILYLISKLGFSLLK